MSKNYTITCKQPIIQETFRVLATLRFLSPSPAQPGRLGAEPIFKQQLEQQRRGGELVVGVVANSDVGHQRGRVPDMGTLCRLHRGDVRARLRK